MRALGSLKLAVILFALAIAVVFIGTLAQVSRDVWQVMEIYFKSWWTWVDLMLFFPRSWFPTIDPGQATRQFVTWTMIASFIAAALCWSNGTVVKSARGIALAILAIATVISFSALRRGGFWFPGGALIGLLMVINLWAAHTTRYRIQAQGTRLVWGLGVTSVGILVASLVILNGHRTDGFQGEPPVSWQTLWIIIKLTLSLLAVGAWWRAIIVAANRRTVQILLAVMTTLLSCWLWGKGDAVYLGDAGMRVLWQLLLATFAAVVLLLGARLLFAKRAGVVVLHAGVGLMMFGQWFVTRFDTELQMTMAEGQTVSFGQDIRSVELAVIQRHPVAAPDKDDVYVIPLTMNGEPTRFLRERQISDSRLPFGIQVVDYQPNSTVTPNRSGLRLANAGRNRDYQIGPARAASGTTMGEVNLASGYFRVIEQGNGQSLGTYLLSQVVLQMPTGRQQTFDLETVEVNGTQYDLQLRFVRSYRDYALTLLDVRKDDYLGTSIPRNYSSRVLLKDPVRKIERELTIWMNNPRRYAGETFYQSGFRQDAFGKEYTTLQVVKNLGWMIPYVSCMICVVGMAYQFTGTLMRFLDRQSRLDDGTATSRSSSDSGNLHFQPGGRSRARLVIPVCVVVAVLCLCGRAMVPPATSSDALDLNAFGQLPLVYQGRVKPFDTLARNFLRVISGREVVMGLMSPAELEAAWPGIERQLRQKYRTLRDVDFTPFKSAQEMFDTIERIAESTGTDVEQVRVDIEALVLERQPAIRWLLDLITDAEDARYDRVIRIYHPQVLDTLALRPRPAYRYALHEIQPRLSELQSQALQADLVRRRDPQQLSLEQRKVLETNGRIQMILSLQRAFGRLQLPEIPDAGDRPMSRALTELERQAVRDAIRRQDDALQAIQPPLVVAPIPADSTNRRWQSYAGAWPRFMFDQVHMGATGQRSFEALQQILAAYRDADSQGFNQGVDRYRLLLQQEPPKELVAQPSAINRLVEGMFGSFYRFESFYNHAAPLYHCAVLYLIASLLPCLGWLRWRGSANWAAYWVVLSAFAIHSLALIARMYLSGRPPVTNLYSSAVFIGWGVVALGLVTERVYRNGLATQVASAVGFITLLIAQQLGGEGDTFQVLQAVLDTQFWLATHVVCITLGYSTTFLAGALGILFILRGMTTPFGGPTAMRETGKMIYGTLCFALFFSFFGTVLGGLWADDSWGRFWGWDPKENGALMIVLWNALVLHARWDRTIGDRGLAVLAVAGNVITAWSWFGVNELGVGLHSYGFTEGRLRALGLAVLAHLLVVVIGWLPPGLWWSYRRHWNRAEASLNGLSD